MSGRLSFWIAVLLLLIAVTLRLWDLTTLPSGLTQDEITNIRITESARDGMVEVFYELEDGGRDGLYQIILVFSTGLMGDGPLGFRLFSVWLGLLAVATVYAAGRRLLGHIGALSAMGLMAASFFPNVLSRSIKPEAWLPLLVALALLNIAVTLAIYRRRRVRGDNTTAATLLGFFLGLGIYIHPTGLLLVLFSLLFIFFMIRINKQLSRRRMSYIGFALLILIIMSIPYLVSSIRNPGLGGVDRLAGDRVNLSLVTLLDSLGGWLVSGDVNASFNLPGRPLLDPFSFIIVVIGIAAALARWRQPRFALLLIPLILISPVFLFAADAPNFLNHAALMPLIALFFGAGVMLLYDNLPPALRRVTELLLLALFVGNLIWTSRDLYVTWPQHSATQMTYNSHLGQLANRIDRTADNLPTIICGWDLNQSATAPTLTDAQLLTLMMNRQDGANLRYVDCYNALVFADGGERQQVIVPNPDVYSRSHPEIQMWLTNHAEPLIADNLPDRGVLLMTVAEPLAARVGQVTTTAVVNTPPESPLSVDRPLVPPFSFGGNLTLLGYLPYESRRYAPGETVTLVTYWRTQGTVPQDLRLFTHILADPAASPPANTDVLNLSARYLRDRDVFIQVTGVPLPESLPPREYFVSVGAYQDSSDERLLVQRDEVGEINASRLFFNTIIVTD